MTEQEIDALADLSARKIFNPMLRGMISRGDAVIDGVSLFKAGYKAAMQEINKLKKEVELLEGVCHRLELFLCCNRGECTACDLSVCFICPECSAHKDVIETLQKLKELRGKK